MPSKACYAYLKPNLVLYSADTLWGSTSGNHQGLLLWRLPEGYMPQTKPLQKVHDLRKGCRANSFRADTTNSPEATSCINLAFIKTYSNFLAAGHVVAQQVVCQWKNEPSERNNRILEWKKLKPGKIRWLRASNLNSSFCRWENLGHTACFNPLFWVPTTMVTVPNPYIVLKCQALFEALEIHELTWSHNNPMG